MEPQPSSSAVLEMIRNPDIRGVISEILKDVVDGVVSIAGEKVKSVLVGGSLSRGEFTACIKNGYVTIYSDIDIAVIVDDPTEFETAINAYVVETNDKYKSKINFYRSIEIKLMAINVFENPRDGISGEWGIYYYDVFKYGKAIYGSNVLKNIPDIGNGAASKESASLMLFNSGIIPLFDWFPQMTCSSDRSFVVYKIAKSIYDLARVILAFYGMTAIKREEVEERFSQLCKKTRYQKHFFELHDLSKISTRYMADPDLNIYKEKFTCETADECIHKLWQAAVWNLLWIRWHITGGKLLVRKLVIMPIIILRVLNGAIKKEWATKSKYHMDLNTFWLRNGILFLWYLFYPEIGTLALIRRTVLRLFRIN